MWLRCTTTFAICTGVALAQSEIGSERAIDHMPDGMEYQTSLKKVLKHGRHLFNAHWTIEDGAGRPQLKGSGGPLSDPAEPLVFPRNFNRMSSPESTSCVSCHNKPLPGAAGDFMANAFVLAERFDYATFDQTDVIPTKESVDELGGAVDGETIGNVRNTPSLFGHGYIELLAREITFDLQAIRNTLGPNGSAPLVSKGISFGTLSRDAAGEWITDAVVGMPQPSLVTSGPGDPPTLIIQPFSHAGVTVSLRAFSNGALNHHIGVQPVERTSDGFDADQDGVVDEATRADITALTLFQAALPPPGRVIPKSAEHKDAIQRGEQLFIDIQCSSCHVPCLPLESDLFLEPNPFNPPGNVQEGGLYQSEHGSFAMDLSDKKTLPRPRLKKNKQDVIEVFAFTDFKLHDITSGPDDPNREPLDMLQVPGSMEFFAGNSLFITPRLWGVASTGPYFHHGKFTTLREAVEAHAGEAQGVMDLYFALPETDQDAIIEFLKSLQILPEKTKSLAIDSKGKKIKWPAMSWPCGGPVPDLPGSGE